MSMAPANSTQLAKHLCAHEGQRLLGGRVPRRTIPTKRSAPLWRANKQQTNSKQRADKARSVRWCLVELGEPSTRLAIAVLGSHHNGNPEGKRYGYPILSRTNESGQRPT
jgi:hypothetical protein